MNDTLDKPLTQRPRLVRRNVMTDGLREVVMDDADAARIDLRRLSERLCGILGTLAIAKQKQDWREVDEAISAVSSELQRLDERVA